jgi:hypothetical protein
MKNAVFWDVAPCRSCVNRRFGGTSAATCSGWFLARGFFYPEDGGDIFLRNVGSHKIYTAPHPRRRYSSGIYWSPTRIESRLSGHPVRILVTTLTELLG